MPAPARFAASLIIHHPLARTSQPSFHRAKPHRLIEPPYQGCQRLVVAAQDSGQPWREQVPPAELPSRRERFKPKPAPGGVILSESTRQPPEHGLLVQSSESPAETRGEHDSLQPRLIVH